MENETNTIKTADIIIKPDLGEVEVNNTTVRLAPVNMKVLLKLVNSSNTVISRGELFDSVWKNQIISDDALTKSISEIRTKLGKYSHYKKLIITIPKKGYQWKPSSLEKPTKTEKTTPPLKILTKSSIQNLLTILLSVVVLTASFLWIANRLVEVKHYPLLLMPIEYHDKSHKLKAINLEDSLREDILTTKNIRFLSKSVSLNQSGYSISNRNNSYNAQWAIEGRIRKMHDKLRFTLSLIDTKTALEIYSESIETDNNENQNQLDKFSLDFIQTIDQKISN